jgi:hypothetical protein
VPDDRAAGPVGPGRLAALADHDPIPGEPEAVRALAGRYAAAAEQAAEQQSALRVQPEQWTGPAAGAMQQHVDRLPADLAAVSLRFARVARALRDFAVALEAAQRRARRALATARSAPASAPPVHLPTVAGLAPLYGSGDSEELARARRQLAEACEERDRAALRCARSLAQAGHDRLQNPSRWHRLLGRISAWAGTLSTGLGMVALVLCWVPGLGEALGAASLSLAAVKLAADALLVAAGDRAAATLVGDTLAVLPMGKAARLGAVMSRESALAAAAERTASSRPWRAAHGRALEALASPLRFERSRGLHGLAAVRSAGLADEARQGWSQLVASVQTSIGTRSMQHFLRSPGGLLDDLAWARAAGPRGAAWLWGGVGIDTVAASNGYLSSAVVGARS